MHAAPTLYSILGVAETVPQEELAATLIAQLTASGNDDEKLQLLRLCRQTLADPQQRAVYDRKLRLQRARERRGEPLDKAGRRAAFRRWSWALVVPAVAIGVWKTGTPRQPQATLAIAPPANRPQANPSPPSEQAEAATTQPQPAARTDDAPPIPAPAGQAGTAMPQAKRPAKSQGFDPAYLAWSVFMVRQSRSSGSGVMIAPDKILTNCHVLAGAATNGMVVIHSLTRQVTPVEKYARLDGEDACLVYAPAAGGDPIEWGSAASLRLSDTLHSFGHPGGSADIVWSEGQLLARAEKNGDAFLISSNYCRPGSSGGPLLDDNGRLVGIVTAVQRYTSRFGEAPRYGACVSLGESVARALLARPLFPIALAPAQFFPGR